MTIADWYFDFVSPFSYLQCERLQALAAIDTPSAGAASRRFSPQTARRAPRRFPPSACSRTVSSSGRRRRSAFRSSSRMSIRSIRCRCCGSRSPAIADSTPCTQIFRFVWRDGRLPDLPIEWAELAASARRSRRRCARSPDRTVKDELRRKPTRRSRGGCSACRRSPSAASSSGALDATDMASRLCAPGAATTTPNMRASPRCRRRAHGKRRASATRAAPTDGRDDACVRRARRSRLRRSRRRCRISRVCSPCSGASRLAANACRLELERRRQH